MHQIKSCDQLDAKSPAIRLALVLTLFETEQWNLDLAQLCIDISSAQ